MRSRNRDLRAGLMKTTAQERVQHGLERGFGGFLFWVFLLLKCFPLLKLAASLHSFHVSE